MRFPGVLFFINNKSGLHVKAMNIFRRLELPTFPVVLDYSMLNTIVSRMTVIL